MNMHDIGVLWVVIPDEIVQASIDFNTELVFKEDIFLEFWID